jgi:hypothetical protein
MRNKLGTGTLKGSPASALTRSPGERAMSIIPRSMT